jgi:hypothetical protein
MASLNKLMTDDNEKLAWSPKRSAEMQCLSILEESTQQGGRPLGTASRCELKSNLKNNCF